MSGQESLTPSKVPDQLEGPRLAENALAFIGSQRHKLYELGQVALNGPELDLLRALASPVLRGIEPVAV